MSVRPSWKGERREWEAVLKEGETLSSFLRAAAAVEVRRRQKERAEREAARERYVRDPLGALDELLARARSS